MKTNDKRMPLHLIRSALIGMASFLLFTVPGLMVIRFWDQHLLAGVITGGGGALVLSLFLEAQRSRGRMVLAGSAGMLAGITGPILVVVAVFLTAPISQYPNQVLWGDVLVMTSNGLFFGAVFGGILFGKKSLLRCMVLCGLIALPFGFLTHLVNTSPLWKDQLATLHPVLGELDLSYLFGSLALGAGAGLCTARFGNAADKGSWESIKSKDDVD